jgi:hypothetical protein
MQNRRSRYRSWVSRVVLAACLLLVATFGIAQTQTPVQQGPSTTGVFGLNLFGPIVGIGSVPGSGVNRR